MSKGSRRLSFATIAAAIVVSGCGGAGGVSENGEGVSGKPSATAGFHGTTINLGVISAMSGSVAVIGQPVTNGNKVWFDHINAQGGIAGKYPVKLIEEDGQYQSDRTVQRYNKIKNDVVAFVQLLGTPPTLATLPQLRSDKIIASPVSQDAHWVQDENLLPIGGPYQIQAINAVEHYLGEGGGGSTDSKICTMSQDDAYGEAGIAGVQFAAKHHGVDISNSQRFKLGTENYSGQIGALRRAGCEMVFLTAAPGDAGKIWGAAAQARYSPQWYAQAPAYVPAMLESPIAEYLQENVLLASEGAEWGDDEIPGMKDMLDRIDRFASGQKPDFYFIYGYNQARAMTALLEKAVKLGDLSREGLLKASRQLGTVKFDNLTGDYQYGPAGHRNPPRMSTMFAIDPDKPSGLGVVQRDITSPAAEAFEFEQM